jgi:hypothetical protein
LIAADSEEGLCVMSHVDEKDISQISQLLQRSCCPSSLSCSSTGHWSLITGHWSLRLPRRLAFAFVRE